MRRTFGHGFRPHRRLMLLAIGLLAMSGTSCTRPTGSPSAVREESVTVPDAAPDVLLETIQNAANEVARLAERLAAGHFPDSVPNELRTQLFTGIKAADKLSCHPDADEAQRETAAKSKLSLLKIGVGRRLIPASRLEDFAAKLAQQWPESELAARADAALLEVDGLAGDPQPDQVAEVLFKFTQSHPDSEVGVDLTLQWSEKLAADGHRKPAIQLCQSAISSYADLPELETIEARLATLQEEEAAAVAERTERIRLAAAQLAALRQRFGGHGDGYFVVYAEENVKPPRHGGMYFYRYEYDVLKGLLAAASYAEALPEKWSWQLIRRFPETPQGREQAYALWRELLRKKKSGKS